ncbi:MAG TPA: MGMT family protein [Verrucomicrobiae bacterium]|nr:MGMT family protein [Verrucomicrobiae bacterium]
MPKSPLYQDIYAAIRTIPFGEVASYSQVAKSVGLPRGAQVVGWALGALSGLENTDIPWWRVINAKRWLTITNKQAGPADQKLWLEKEGRTVTEKEGVFVVDGEDWWDAPVVPPRGAF